MTNKEMVERYLSSVNMRLVQGARSLEPILPFFMMDVAYNMWRKDISPICVRHHLKRMNNEWLKRYGLLNRRFFRAFTDEEQDEVIGKMDSFDSYIWNHVMVAKVQIINFLDDLDTEKAGRCASLLIINILCQSAQIVWRNVYRDSLDHGKTNTEIESLEMLSSKFMNLYHDSVSKRVVNPNASKMIVDSVDVLCHKLIRWLYVDLSESEPESSVIPQEC